jgi:hypothetical protein
MKRHGPVCGHVHHPAIEQCVADFDAGDLVRQALKLVGPIVVVAVMSHARPSTIRASRR